MSERESLAMKIESLMLIFLLQIHYRILIESYDDSLWKSGCWCWWIIRCLFLQDSCSPQRIERKARVVASLRSGKTHNSTRHQIGDHDELNDTEYDSQANRNSQAEHG